MRHHSGWAVLIGHYDLQHVWARPEFVTEFHEQWLLPFVKPPIRLENQLVV
jgi:hypothetical protein